MDEVSLEQLQDKLKRLEEEELSKDKIEYNYRIFNNMIKKKSINSIYWLNMCNNYKCYTLSRSGKKLCSYHQTLIDNPPKPINIKLLEKLKRLQNDEELKTKYIFEIKNDRVRYHCINSVSKRINYEYLCDNLDCQINSIHGKKYCVYHQRTIVDNPIPQELIDELEILQDENINPEYKNIEFKIIKENNKNNYKITKKTQNREWFIGICLHKYCIKEPSCNYKNETQRLYCSEHKLDDMIDISTSRCKNIIDGEQCQVSANKDYDNYCFHCFYKIFSDKIPVINLKIKENIVFDFIKSIYTLEIRDKFKIKDIIYDKYSGNKRPDIVFICENYVIVIEVDEYQHKQHSQPGAIYSKENEKNKMNLIREHYLKENKKTIYLRFNPDDYLNKDNIKIKSPWDKNEDRKLVLVNKDDWDNRLRILKQKIDYYLKKEKIKNNSTNYLFYDGY